MGCECVACREIEVEYFVGPFSAVGREVHTDSDTQLPAGGQVLPERQDRESVWFCHFPSSFPGRRSNG